MSGRRFAFLLAILLVAGLGVRTGYVFAQPATDPSFDRPFLDGAYYLEWAWALVRGQGGPSGAYYLAPLYAFVLGGFLAVFGENFTLLYLLQQAAAVASAGALALAGRRLVGAGAGLVAGALVLLYHPTLFFASRPLGESLAILLLALALLFASARSAPSAGAAGVVCGLGVLTRPNLLLVPAVWVGGEAARRRWLRAGLLAAALGLAVLPVTVRNLVVSGHLVPVSSNMGVTFYHGNGPWAVGVYTPPSGFSGKLSDQRHEATMLAGFLTQRSLDPVEADRWWGRQALRTRIENPVGTALLLGRRLLLLVANEELGLDYAPSLDRNPWRWSAPLPFAVIVALAAAGLLFLGVRQTGGWTTWGAVLACAMTPFLFYVSSRYRLPTAAMLCVPAGAGLTALVAPRRWVKRTRRQVGMAATVMVLALSSLSFPTGELADSVEAVALANRAVAWRRAGDLGQAESDLRAALSKDPLSVPALFRFGVLLEARGREREAEAMYRRALSVDPERAESAGNLSKLLLQRQRPDEAVPMLRRALAAQPYHRVCWTNLVVALAAQGDLAGAQSAARDAEAFGVELNPELLEAIQVAPP